LAASLQIWSKAGKMSAAVSEFVLMRRLAVCAESAKSQRALRRAGELNFGYCTVPHGGHADRKAWTGSAARFD